MASMEGKFIVLEGGDGSGKTVQFEKLIFSLPESLKLGTLDFPQYSESSSYFAKKYLTGEYGSEVGPYTASIFFAMDRFDARSKVLQWMDEGRLVLANRYVASNMAHQGAKIEDKAARRHFYEWLYQLEYEIFAVPKPDLNIVLHVPTEIAMKLIAKRGKRSGLSRDIHEENLEYQKRSAEAYLEIAEIFPNDFTVIECAPRGEMLPADVIHGLVLEAAGKIINN